jgi:hypothetical protein
MMGSEGTGGTIWAARLLDAPHEFPRSHPIPSSSRDASSNVEEVVAKRADFPHENLMFELTEDERIADPVHLQNIIETGGQRLLNAGNLPIHRIWHKINWEPQIPPIEQRACGLDRHNACYLIELIPNVIGQLVENRWRRFSVSPRTRAS